MDYLALAKELTILDSHIDVPYRLLKDPEDLSKRAQRGDFDYERAKDGGLDIAFMAIFVPPELQSTGKAKDKADELCDLMDKLVSDNPNQFTALVSPGDYVANTNLVFLPRGLENGAALEASLENLHHFYKREIRYITLTHAKDNDICDSSYDKTATWGGLSPFGKQLIPEMNRIGMMIDVSHVTDKVFYDVIELSETPVVATHSSCRHFTPGFERNMSDQMIKDIAKQGGIVQINFGSAFINEHFCNTYDIVRKKITGFIRSNKLDSDNQEVIDYKAQLIDKYKLYNCQLSEVVDHIEHAVGLIGIDHVGIGSDFDGVGPTLPVGLEDVSKYPNLLEELGNRGFEKSDLTKICGSNFLNFWKKIESFAT